MVEAFLHGFVLSLGLILPLGVQNVFVFNQGAVQSSLWRAMPVVLTAAVCDTLLILLAVLGVSLVVLTFDWLETALYAVGFFFLLYMGYLTWKSTPSTEGDEAQRFTPRKQILFAASVSLFNPHAILDTIGVIGTSSLSYGGTEKWAFTLSCILVSWLWFFALSVAGRTAGRLDRSGKLLRSLNVVSACIIWAVALFMGAKLAGIVV
ncbi:LysE/ArgO family amino acid transporter [Brevibacillus sp. H7]|uniref:LysE/ArgO family amino acid transporter n=1 Tax=Brevibacillus sp. H7 TaxID=3349138 RepID=UPI0038216D8E